jgi:hypothetical protein
MQGVIERRRAYLHLMRRLTLEKGFFTVQEIQQEAGVPRSTAQDWVLRLSDEGCVVLIEPPRGRSPAQYAAISALPRTACRRIFTAIDGDLVEIVHECLSSACAAFCGHHHGLGCGDDISVLRDGPLLREFMRLGEWDVKVGLYPHPAVAIAGISRDGDEIIQKIRSVGGPAFSLAGMMGRARGVLSVEVSRAQGCTEGILRTRALTHLTIGLDNTDSPDDGATFALAIALLEHLGGFSGVFPISHQVAMLFPGILDKTAGNSCSAIELAIEPGMYDQVVAEVIRFVSDESVSSDWGIAIRAGLHTPEMLRDYGFCTRRKLVSIEECYALAALCSTNLYGGTGVIGALAAVALSGLPSPVLLDPRK